MTSLTKNTSALPTFIVDGAGNIAGPSTISLASNISLAAGASTSVVPVGQSNAYLFAYVFGGTTPSLQLQSLAIDGVTWNTLATVGASGQQFINIVAGSGGAAMRLYNAGTGTITGLIAGLVQ